MAILLGNIARFGAIYGPKMGYLWPKKARFWVHLTGFEPLCGDVRI